MQPLRPELGRGREEASEPELGELRSLDICLDSDGQRLGGFSELVMAVQK